MPTKYCPYCRKETEFVAETRREEYAMRGENPPIAVDAMVRVCPECGEDISDVDLDDRTLVAVYAEYRRRKGWLRPEEIKGIRERCGLDPVAFSRMMGWEDRAMGRYEAGSLQTAEREAALRAVAADPEFAIRLLERNRERFAEEEYAVVRERVAQAARGAGGKVLADGG